MLHGLSVIAPLFTRRFIVVAGKGGVGRTTVTAALALSASRAGKKVLICQTKAKERPTVDLQIEDSGVAISATVSVHGRTGVEMEALTAVSIAALTIYDMVKAIDHQPSFL